MNIGKTALTKTGLPIDNVVSADELRDGMSEKQFLAQVRALAEGNGWLVFHCHDSRRSPEGFPDCVFVRRGDLIFSELKRQSGKLTYAQQEWITRLTTVERHASNVQVFTWFPSDWPEIVEVLQ